MTGARRLAAVPFRADPPRAAELARLAVRVREIEIALERLDSIERAKRVLMERHDLDEHGAFELLRRTARCRREAIAAVAQRVVNSRSEPAARPSATDHGLTRGASGNASATSRAARAWGVPERQLRARSTP